MKFSFQGFAVDKPDCTYHVDPSKLEEVAFDLVSNEQGYEYVIVSVGYSKVLVDRYCIEHLVNLISSCDHSSLIDFVDVKLEER